MISDMDPDSKFDEDEDSNDEINGMLTHSTHTHAQAGFYLRGVHVFPPEKIISVTQVKLA